MSDPADIDLTALPPEVRAAFEAERAARRALEADVAMLAEHNRRLEHLVAEFRQALYGKRSEKLSEDARQLAFEDLEAAVAAVEAAQGLCCKRRLSETEGLWTRGGGMSVR